MKEQLEEIARLEQILIFVLGIAGIISGFSGFKTTGIISLACSGVFCLFYGKSQKLLMQLELIEERQRFAKTNLRETNGFHFNPIGMLTQIPADKQCEGCKYLYGAQNIVCAVHPFGHEGNHCNDRTEKCLPTMS